MNFSVFTRSSTPASLPSVSQQDLQQIVNHLNGALDVFQPYEGRMTGADIRLRSLLTVLRDELTAPDPARDRTRSGHPVPEAV